MRKNLPYGKQLIDKKDLNLLLKKVESYGNLNLIREIEMSEEGGRFINTAVKHCFYEISTNENFLNFSNLPIDHFNIWSRLFLHNPMIHSTIFFKRDIIVNHSFITMH